MSASNKLRWQCRRGSRELDLILLKFLETGYPAADAGQQQCFSELLAMEDNEIMRYLLGEALPESEAMHGLLAMIRSLSV